jgi:hypothetical protein
MSGIRLCFVRRMKEMSVLLRLMGLRNGGMWHDIDTFVASRLGEWILCTVLMLPSRGLRAWLEWKRRSCTYLWCLFLRPLMLLVIITQSLYMSGVHSNHIIQYLLTEHVHTFLPWVAIFHNFSISATGVRPGNSGSTVSELGHIRHLNKFSFWSFHFQFEISIRLKPLTYHVFTPYLSNIWKHERSSVCMHHISCLWFLYFELLSSHIITSYFQNGTGNKRGLRRTSYLRQSVDTLPEFCFKWPSWYARRRRLMPLTWKWLRSFLFCTWRMKRLTAQQHEFRTDVYTEPHRHVDICRLLLKQAL